MNGIHHLGGQNHELAGSSSAGINRTITVEEPKLGTMQRAREYIMIGGRLGCLHSTWTMSRQDWVGLAAETRRKTSLAAAIDRF